MNNAGSDDVAALWERAEESLRGAELTIGESLFDMAASRAYYAAFYAATAALLTSGREFRKHSAVVGAVHRDFVHAGYLDARLGKALSWLFELRGIGDYGMSAHVAETDARKAVELASELIPAFKKIAGRTDRP